MFFITYCHFLYWQNMPLLSNSRKKISDLVTSLQLFLFPELPVGHNLYQRVLAPRSQCLSYEVWWWNSIHFLHTAHHPLVKVLLGCSLLTGKINVHKKKKKKANWRWDKTTKKKKKQEQQLSLTICGKELIFSNHWNSPLLLQLRSGKKNTFSIKRYALSLKLVEKIRKARWKIKQLSRHLPDIENSLNKHLQCPSLHCAFESHL